MTVAPDRRRQLLAVPSPSPRLLVRHLLVGALLLTGCQARGASPQPGSPPAPPTSPPASRSPDHLARGPAATATAHAPAPPGCARDLDCPGFLRCQQGGCQIPPALDGTGPTNGPRVVFEPTTGQSSSFLVELAVEPAEQVRGLMYRPRLAPSWGMLFLYAADHEHVFWMRNTAIPLDLVFLDAAGTVVCVVEGAEPFTDSPRGCGRPSRHVLELNAGQARRHGIGTGTPYRLVNLPATTTRSGEHPSTGSER